MKVFKKLVLITALILVTCINVSFANQTGEVNTSGIRIRKEAEQKYYGEFAYKERG